MVLHLPTSIPGPSLDGNEESEEPRVLRAPFGDGYSQRTPDGINNVRTTFSLSWFNLSRAETDLLLAVFRQSRGVEIILVARTGEYDSDGEPVMVKTTCKSWKKSKVGGDAFTVSATFIEEMDP